MRGKSRGKMAKFKKKVIKNESELKKWVMDNYRKLGYSDMVRKDIGECPDLIMLRNGKEVKVELETVASNFLSHKHPFGKVDEIVCIVKDMELEKPVIGIDELEFKGNSNVKVTLSIDDKVYRQFQKYCRENAIMLSKKLEIDMINIMRKESKNE